MINEHIENLDKEAKGHWTIWVNMTKEKWLEFGIIYYW